MITVRNALAAAVRQLNAAGVERPEQEAAWLLAHLLSTTVGSLRARPEAGVEADTAARFERLVERRSAREPIQYVLGTEEFMGLTFRVTPAVLIPRLDTETLVRAAADLLRGRPARVVDVGTGSGAIAVALAVLLPEATVLATDISEAALEVAQENARRSGVADRVSFAHGDLLQPAMGYHYDAVLSNPPYIGAEELDGLMPEVRLWEPQIALTPGPDGASVFRRLAADAVKVLKPEGFLGVEVGLGQAPAVQQVLAGAGMTTTVHKDGRGIDRAIIAYPA